MTWQEQQEAVIAAVKRFPDEFGLRAFPGDRFCVSEAASYFGEEPMLYTCKLIDEAWVAFAKGTEAELKKEMVILG